jgi:hypothetical protein
MYREVAPANILATLIKDCTVADTGCRNLVNYHTSISYQPALGDFAAGVGGCSTNDYNQELYN